MVRILCLGFCLFARSRAWAAAGDTNWDTRFNLPGVDGVVYAVASSGEDLYVGGDFTAAGGDASIQRVARWDGTAWHSVGQGVNAAVRAISVGASGIYIGGDFMLATQSDGSSVGANRLARWDGVRWNVVGDNDIQNGLDGSVAALAVAGSTLFVGGSFANALTAGGPAPVPHLARFDSGSWSAPGGGVDGSVSALAVTGAGVFVGGVFSNVNLSAPQPAARFALWDGANWVSPGQGVTGAAVNALATDGSGLVYVGGQFTAAGGIPVGNVAVWDGSALQQVGGLGTNGVDGPVYSLAVGPAGLYVGGLFTNALAAGGTKILTGAEALWTGATWTPLGKGGGGAVYAMAAVTTNLYVGGRLGSFQNADATRVFVSGISAWAGTSWAALGAGLGLGDATTGDPRSVMTLGFLGTNLYAGGAFSSAGGVAAAAIARFDGSQWSPVGRGVDLPVHAVFAAGTNLFVGGEFTQARQTGSGSVNAPHIARWDGAQWHPMGFGVDDNVYSIAVSGSNVYVGGRLVEAVQSDHSTVLANCIVMWDGLQWNALDTGVLGEVHAVVVIGKNVFVGGSITSAGPSTVSNVAYWDGANWGDVGGGVIGTASPPVRAMATDGTNLFAGGTFAFAGGAPVNNVARWDGSNWYPLGTGFNHAVSALTFAGGYLYAGGSFTAADGGPVTYCARWDGVHWIPLGTGLTNSFPTLASSGVNAIAVQGASVFFGGPFDRAGGKQSSFFARWFDADQLPASPPALDISLGSGVATLSWPATGLGYSLQSAASFVPGSSWVGVDGSLRTNTNSISMTVPLTGAGQFYRLRR